MSLTQEQETEVKRIAELEVRRYFDTYLREVFPAQAKLLRQHTYTVVEAHNADKEAHGAVEHRFNRFQWTLMGAAAAGGTGLGALLTSVAKAAFGT